MTLNTGDITNKHITYNSFALEMTLPITVNNKHVYNVVLINDKYKVVFSTVFLSVVIVSRLPKPFQYDFLITVI